MIKSPSSSEEFATSLTQWRRSVYGDSSGSLTVCSPQSEAVTLRQQVTDEVLRNLVVNRNNIPRDGNILPRHCRLFSMPDRAQVGCMWHKLKYETPCSTLSRHMRAHAHTHTHTQTHAHTQTHTHTCTQTQHMNIYNT